MRRVENGPIRRKRGGGEPGFSLGEKKKSDNIVEEKRIACKNREG